jgi:Flp pilus assembly protein TadD
MTPDEISQPQGTPRPRRLLGRLLIVVLVLVVVTVGANVAWWLNRPELEPMPSVPMGKMDAEVRELIQSASAKVVQSGRDASAWGDLGAVFFVHNFEAPAQVCFRNAEALDSRDYRWPYLLGVSLTYSDADEMMAAYRRAEQRCTNQAHVRLRLAEALLDRGALDDASIIIERALADSPSNPRAKLAKARLLFARGKLDEARLLTEESASGSADKRAPYLLLAQLCRRMKDSAGEAEAVAALQKIPDGFTTWDDPDLTAILALRRDRATRLAKAENLAQSGDSAGKGILNEMSSESDGSSAAVKLAKTLLREKKYQEAESLLRSQVRSAPQDERLHFLLGGACFQQEKFSEAEGEYRQVVALKPDNVDAWFNRGVALLKLNQTGEAKEAFATAVRISPSRVYARVNLAELLLAEGKNAEAAEHLEAALRLSPKDEQIRELLAKAKAGGP